MAIVVLVLWLAAAGAGATLLRAGGAARKLAAHGAADGVTATAPVRVGAVPLTADGRPPPVPRVRVSSPPGEHPMLEFCHPALAITGIACWLMFVLVQYRPFAWIAFAVLVLTIAVGLSWLRVNMREARHQAAAAWTFPPRLIVLHGLIVALAIALTILTAVSASGG